MWGERMACQGMESDYITFVIYKGCHEGGSDEIR